MCRVSLAARASACTFAAVVGNAAEIESSAAVAASQATVLTVRKVGEGSNKE
jgi:hypothetical protein